MSADNQRPDAAHQVIAAALLAQGLRGDSAEGANLYATMMAAAHVGDEDHVSFRGKDGAVLFDLVDGKVRDFDAHDFLATLTVTASTPAPTAFRSKNLAELGELVNGADEAKAKAALAEMQRRRGATPGRKAPTGTWANPIRRTGW